MEFGHFLKGPSSSGSSGRGLGNGYKESGFLSG